MDTGNIASGLLTFASGYLVAQVPPYHDRTTGKASVLVVGCIDPRYTHDLAFYLTHSWELHADYDLINFAGASLGVMEKPSWKDMCYDHIDLAIKLHGVTEVWCFDHLDCGMYKAVHEMEKDEDPKIHIETMKAFRADLKVREPFLKFRGFLININGGISEVV